MIYASMSITGTQDITCEPWFRKMSLFLCFGSRIGYEDDGNRETG